MGCNFIGSADTLKIGCNFIGCANTLKIGYFLIGYPSSCLISTGVHQIQLHFCFSFHRERMDNYTTGIELFNDTTPKLPNTPLYQEASEDFGIFFYVSMIFIGSLLILYLCNCFFKSHKYHSNDRLPATERLQII